MKQFFTFGIMLASILILHACTTETTEDSTTTSPIENTAPKAPSATSAPDEKSVADQIKEANVTGVVLNKVVISTDMAVVEANTTRDRIYAYAEELVGAVENALSGESDVKGRLTIDCSLRPNAPPTRYLSYLGMSESSLPKVSAAVESIPELSTKNKVVEFKVIIDISIE